MKEKIERNIQDLNENFEYSQRQLEEELMFIDDERRKFQQYLEYTAELINQSKSFESIDFSENYSLAHQIINQSNDEALFMVKKANFLVEEAMEENQVQFNRQLNHYEEELYLEKRKGS